MYGLFIVGLILIIKGGDWFVDSARRIAQLLGMPEFVIGATIVSLATTLPEIIVSITATARGNVDMAAGNAIGSVTANTALIMGLCIVCIPTAVERKKFTPKALMLLAAPAALILGCIFTERRNLVFEGESNNYYSLSVIGIAALAIIFIIFFIENFISIKNSSQRLPNREEDADDEESEPQDGILKSIVFFIAGAAGIVLGAQLLVKYGTQIAESLNIPQRIISVIAIAIGTSLPELVTTVTAIRKKAGSLSIGNILGANIIDLTLILPICSIVSAGKGMGSLAVSVASVHTDMIVCLAAAAIAIIPTIIAKKFRRWQGVALLLGYAGYVISIVI